MTKRYSCFINHLLKLYMLIISNLPFAINNPLISCKVKNFMEINRAKLFKKVFI